MKHLCISKIIMFFMLISSFAYADTKNKSAIVYYGDDISWSMVGTHDYIIVEPEHINVYTHGFKTYKNKLYAYVPLGEVQESQKYSKKIDKSWVIGKNKAWKSKVMDLSSAAYRKFMLDVVVAPLHEKGFRNFFFDTLDSYQIVYKDKNELQEQIDGLALLIESIHEKYPQSKLILNRGFEVFDRVKDIVQAVLFESYYNGLSSKLSYKKLSSDDRIWLDTKLKPIEESGVDIIALDYAKGVDKEELSKRIENLQSRGFIPYISNKELNRYGISSRVAVKREVLILYDGNKIAEHEHGAHKYASLPVEYLGYVPVLRDIYSYDFSKNVSDRYAGVIVWLEDSKKSRTKFFKWIKNNSKKGLYTLIFRSFGLKSLDNSLSILGIDVKEISSKPQNRRTITNKDSMISYEVDVKVQMHSRLLQPRAAKKLLSYKEKSQESTLAAIMPWGGYAVDEVSMIEISGDNLWIIDPFKLYVKALRLPNIPMLDPTTQNGTRLLFTHIDGGGIMNRAEFNPEQFSGDVIYSDILKKYKIPHTVSIVGAEIMSNGMYPKLHKQLEQIAKDIYALPNIETATHTFSHPFEWRRIKNGDLDEKYRLKPKNYKFSLDYEIKGTLDYIENNLTSADTVQSKLVLWTGDCIPTQNVLEYTAKNSILNMNGGDTTITKNQPWMYLVAPYGIRKGDYYQVYAGAENENVYTNMFKGPYWGFKNVIQTFELTDKPKRLKPVDIYYHFYSGSKLASVKALESVFDWAMEQDLMPIFTSEYIPKVLEFYDGSISKINDGLWLFSGVNNLLNIRVLKTFGTPDINLSIGVSGYKDDGDSRYISLVGKDDKKLIIRDKSKDESYLVSANVFVDTNNSNRYHLKGYVPIRSRWHLKNGCVIEANPKADVNQLYSGITTLSYKTIKEADIYVKCK